ncbi:phospho-N-acetylmuramoyl-pentapeptide-transferase, partial [Staphylococcus aureus]
VLGETAFGIFCMIMLFAHLGLLPYNINLAKVFMGDTGSLALGGIFVTISIMGNKELSLIIIGLVLVTETFSVMLQVATFKLPGRRIFK